MNHLAHLFSEQRGVMCPGVGDALTARIVEHAGFPTLSMSGNQVAAAFGYPDIGLVTLTEMVNQASHICAAVSIPVIVDGDNGHGNVVNVARTIREFEKIGAAGLHLEDQVIPKRCGHMAGHVLVGIDEMCGKVKAAVDARRSSEFQIIARSDAIPTLGIDMAIERGIRYRESGADAVMVMAPRSRDDLVAYRKNVDGPLVVTMGSWDFTMSADELGSIGYQVVMFPLTTMRCAVKAVQDCMMRLRAAGKVDHGPASMIPIDALNAILGLGTHQALDAKFGAHEQRAKSNTSQ